MPAMVIAGRNHFNLLGWGTIGALILAPSLLMAYDWSLNRFFPVTVSSLVFSPVELGDLQPGEERIVECPIRNQSKRTLRLLPPKGSCGCVSLGDGAMALKPDESVVLQFKFRAPDVPRGVNERVLLQAADFPALYWRIDIHGQTSAAVWSVPARVKLVSSGSETAESSVEIHHDTTKALKAIRTDSPIILLDPQPDGNGVQRVKISLSPSAKDGRAAGAAVIDVVGSTSDGDEALLHIPVSWSPPPKMRWVPSKIGLGHYGTAPTALRQEIAVLGLTKSEADRLQVTPLQAWVRVEGKKVTGDLVEVQLVFDPPSMPAVVEQGILQLSVDDLPCQTVEAYGRR